MTEFFTPNVLIGCAAGAFALGYLIVNQMKLRVLMFIGSVFYIGYYATAAAVPLWGGIYTTAGMMVTNLIGMSILLLRRFPISLPRAHTDIYPKFDMLTPGDFRLVMKTAERFTLEPGREITREGEPVRHLYYILSGQISVAKRGNYFTMPEGLFIGEVAYLLDRPSSATTTLETQAEVICWDLNAMRAKSASNPRLKLAIDAMLGHDLAQKVAEAVAHPASPNVGRA